ncbi:MAG TPA: serine/threonine-protein kinase [Polyangiaceae bacterium]|jgi:serine/threonine-protein kinase
MVAPERFAEGALVGHFRLERVIGRGGMGVVWAAVDERDGRRVALKFLDDVRRDDPVSHARFLREAELASKLTHPNVVRVHAIDYTLEGTPFLVMDLLEGESLRARMKFAQRLSPRECGALLAPVASAARAAHEAGIVHRDLKPENVFLSTDGVRVLDFGIAKRLSADEVKDTFTSTGAMLGTPAYMAPEQIYGERDLDGKADVWALGVIVYECLSGVRPVDGGVGQILKAITSGRIVPLAERVPEAGALGRFVMTMLATEPSKRPSMDEVERVLVGLRDDAMPVARRRAWLAPAVGLSAVAIGALAIVRFTAHRSAPPASVASESVPTPTMSASTPSSVAIAPPSPPPTASSARQTSVKIQQTSVAPAPAPVARAPEFDVVLGRVAGMGNQPTQSDVVDALRAMKPCLPAPAAGERWTIALDATWPKGGARTEAFEARRNGAPLANAQIEACAKRIFDAAKIAAPDGQDDAAGTSYIRMSAGYY